MGNVKRFIFGDMRVMVSNFGFLALEIQRQY